MSGYRCCEHCADDVEDGLHDVDVDDHDTPCNAVNSDDCPGRSAVQPQPETENNP